MACAGCKRIGENSMRNLYQNDYCVKTKHGQLQSQEIIFHRWIRRGRNLSGLKSDMKRMKEDRTKTIHLLHAVHAGRGIDKGVFSHEISEHPPSITKDGVMYKGIKSDILDGIGGNSEACQTAESGNIHADALVIDGPVLVHLIKPKQSAIFHDYIHRDIFAYINSHLKKPDIKRVDIVWDT